MRRLKQVGSWSLQFSFDEDSASVVWTVSGILCGTLGRGFRGGSLGSGLLTFGGKGGGTSDRLGVSVTMFDLTVGFGGFTVGFDGFAGSFGGFAGGSDLFTLVSL